MNKQEIIDKIFTTLTSQRFADWYADTGDFGGWLVGDLAAKSEEEIKQHIEKMFHLNN